MHVLVHLPRPELIHDASNGKCMMLVQDWRKGLVQLLSPSTIEFMSTTRINRLRVTPNHSEKDARDSRRLVHLASAPARRSHAVRLDSLTMQPWYFLAGL